jgi:predicted SnoaL-like aldol condensation-catalyzing enzyme
MKSIRQKKIITLLKGIETGKPSSVEVINPKKYIQHNPQTYEGRDGLAALFKQLSLSSPSVNIVRIFEDSDYVFAHTEYDFSSSNIGLEVFRFEEDMTVEHWDNIQLRKKINTSNNSMVDGSTEITDLDKTDKNKQLVSSYVKEILINKSLKKLDEYIYDDNFIQHNPFMSNGKASLIDVLMPNINNEIILNYTKNHKILANGNFVLSVCEGFYKANHSAIYDLYRIDKGRIVEHWDTIEKIPCKEEWKNENGKF